MIYNLKKLFTVFFVSFFWAAHSTAQNVVEDLQSETDVSSNWSEEIKIISNSRKILILTNDNQILTQGDFVSLIQDGKLVVRALVIKTNTDRVGIKIVKVYNEDLWGRTKINTSVGIVRGDDSYFNRAAVPKNEMSSTDSAIANNFDENELISLSSDFPQEKEKRPIQGDHLFTLGFGQFKTIDRFDGSVKYNLWHLSWDYQLLKNTFTEFSLGYGTLKQFPAIDLNSKAYVLEAKIKYSFSLPAYIFIQPYVGMSKLKVQTSGGNGDEITAEQLDEENYLVNKIEKARFEAGATVLKRIVPGWLARADLGMNELLLGLTIEI
jgi:uncharacterized Zn ribbon protein